MGGTKTEMERLIADANKVKEANGEMGNLSIESFADVTEAIHVMQTELGITGTTSKEASQTISGSLNAMKGAWSNLLTGIADENADFDQLVSNLVESVGAFGENIMPRIEQTMNGIVNLILKAGETLLPEILNMGVNLISNLITGITSNIGSLMTGVNQVISTIVSTIVTLLPQIVQARNSNNRVIDTRASTTTANFDTADGRRRAFNSRDIDRQHRHAD